MIILVQNGCFGPKWHIHAIQLILCFLQRLGLGFLKTLEDVEAALNTPTMLAVSGFWSMMLNFLDVDQCNSSSQALLQTIKVISIARGRLGGIHLHVQCCKKQKKISTSSILGPKD